MKSFTILKDATSIQQLFKNLERQKEIQVSVKINSNLIIGTMIFKFTMEDEPIIHFSNEINSIVVDDHVEISFFFKDTYFSFNTQVLNVFSHSFSIKKPQSICSYFDRVNTRYKIKKEECAFLIFQGTQEPHRIIDISTTGLSFELNANTFSEGEVIRNIFLSLNESLSLYFDATVKYKIPNKNTYICGINFTNAEWESSQALFQYIFQRSHINLKSLADFTENEIAKIDSSTRYHNLRMYGNEKEEFAEGIKKIEKLKRRPTIFANTVYHKNNKIAGANSAIRIYNRTFLLHQPIMLPETYRNPKVNAEIFIGLAEHLLNHPYFNNLLAYIDQVFEWHQSVLNNISTIINNKNKLCVERQEYYEYNISDTFHIISNEYNTEILDEPSAFLNYCQKNLSPIECSCLEYNKNNFSLSEVKGIFHTLGFSVQRRLFSTCAKDKAVVYSLAECYTQNIDMNDNLNTLRIYFSEDQSNLNEVLYSILPEAIMFFKIHQISKFRIYIHHPCNDIGEISIEGFSRCLTTHRMMMNREGVVEFIRLLMSNFEYYTKFYNLSQPQKSIWSIEKFFPGTSIGNVAGTLKIKRAINPALLEKAINIFVEKNDAMRIRVVEENGKPKQYIANYAYFDIDFIDFSNKDIQAYYQWDEERIKEYFDLNDACLFYFAIIKFDENLYAFYIKTHHMISDAWTMTLLGSQIYENYYCLEQGIKISSAKKPSYLDFVLDEEEFKYSEKILKFKNFWSEKYDKYIQAARLKPNIIESYSTKANRKTFILDHSMSSRIYTYCQEHKISVFSLFMAVFSLIISNHTGNKDVVIGTPILNRSGVKEKEIVGIFVSTIPVRISIDGNMGFDSYLSYVTKEINACLKNQKYSYELILKDYREKHKVSDKLYECMFSYQNSKFKKGEDPDIIEARWHFNKNQVESLILHLDDRESFGKLLLNIDYLADLFQEKEIDHLFDQLIHLLTEAITNPNSPINTIGLIDQNEKNILHDKIKQFNSTEAEYPKDKTIQQMFEEQVKKTPERTALIFGNQSMTYLEYNEKANQLARMLRTKGVKPDQIVGIVTYRSFEMMIGIMGILKAGGAYLPIEPTNPEERKNYMLDNANVSIVLMQKEWQDAISNRFEKIMLDDPHIYTGDGSNLPLVNKSVDLAYVIYTSGSTGKPKGVMIEHYSVINRLNWMQKNYPLDEQDVILQKTPYTFDVSVWELFWWSFIGAKLAILCPGGEKEPTQILDSMDKYKVTTMHFVPSMLSVFLDYLQREGKGNKANNLKQVFASGEALAVKHNERFYETFDQIGASLTNLYGPTEATVDVSYYDCKKEDQLKTIPIGKAIDNIRLYVLNENLEIQPIGVCGELYIAGDGLARGYLNAPELTAQKFINSKFVDEGRIYKTGDLARWLPTGDIEYLGRIDNQVKIRGLRIELGEIEYQLLQIHALKDAVVVDRKDAAGNSYLCAYFVSDTKVPVTELREHLSQNLPQYMIPSYFIKLEELPLSSNGKVDRKKLPEPSLDALDEEEYIEPRNEEEKRISEIWKTELKRERVSIRSNFFYIGGDSLMAINVAIRIGDHITISDIYNYPTIEALAQAINNNNTKNQIFYSIKRSTEQKKTAMVCVPYGGGAPIVFNELGNEICKISDEYAVYSVIIPGHDFGKEAGVLRPIEEVAQKCVEEIKKLKETEIVLYGHCVGSAMTIEIARLLEKEEIKIKAVFIGAIIPPKHVKLYGNIIDPWKWSKDDQVIKYLNQLGGFNYTFEKDEKELIMKVFRHDVRCYMKYFHGYFKRDANKISAQVYCIIGDQDASAGNFKKNFKEWKQYCKSVQLITLHEANHYFIKTHAKEVAEIIDNSIKNKGGSYDGKI